MAKTVTSYSGLLAALETAKDKALEGASVKAKDLVQDKIMEEVYSVPEGSYERTMGLYDSMINFPLEKKGNVSEVKVAHDWMNMSRDPSKFQHASLYWSPWDYRSFVAETVHDGTSGSLFGMGQHWYERKPYMDYAKDDLRKGEYRKFMVEMLKRQGYKVK